MSRWKHVQAKYTEERFEEIKAAKGDMTWQEAIYEWSQQYEPEPEDDFSDWDETAVDPREKREESSPEGSVVDDDDWIAAKLLYRFKREFMGGGNA